MLLYGKIYISSGKMLESHLKWQKLTINEQNVDIKILSPRGCLSLPLGYIHKNMKKIYIISDFKEIFFKLATNGQSDKA